MLKDIKRKVKRKVKCKVSGKVGGKGKKNLNNYLPLLSSGHEKTPDIAVFAVSGVWD